MKIDPNFIVTDIKGSPLEGIEDAIHAGKILANVLYTHNGPQPLKYHSWALKLYNKEAVEVDGAELAVITDIVTNSMSITTAVKVPLLNHFEQIKKQ